MNDIGVKLNGDELEVTNSKTQQCFRLPFHLANQANIDQWFRNLHRQVQYAGNNVGWAISKEYAKTILKTAMSDGKVREAVERNKSFWEESAEGAREEWFYTNGIGERPTQGPPKPGPLPPGPPPPPKPKNIYWVLLATALGIIRIAAVYFYSSGNSEVNSKTLYEQGENAKQMIVECITVVGSPEMTLNKLVGDKEYFMMCHPFKTFVDETVAAGSPANGKTIEEATLAELERNLRDWELRCGCDLTIDCPKPGITD
jgi:hypothetical protein